MVEGSLPSSQSMWKNSPENEVTEGNGMSGPREEYPPTERGGDSLVRVRCPGMSLPLTCWMWGRTLAGGLASPSCCLLSVVDSECPVGHSPSPQHQVSASHVPQILHQLLLGKGNKEQPPTSFCLKLR
jgi:hypothetical protein